MFKQTVRVAREVIADICLHLIRKENQVNGYEERNMLAAVFYAVGRGGEVSTTNWNSVLRNITREYLQSNWGKKKKGQQHLITLHPNAKNRKRCFVHSMVYYLTIGQGTYKVSAIDGNID